MSWLSIFLARFAMGERWRKSTPAEQRHFAGLFFLIPVCFEIAIFTMKYARHLVRWLDTTSAVTLWLLFTIGASALCFISLFWGRHIPTKVSLILAAFAWVLLITTIIHYDFLWNLHDN